MPTDEVTRDDREPARAIYFDFKRSDLPCEGARRVVELRTASEQRGYDRAIAEVVAGLREQHDGRLVSRIYLADAIEAGEHKP